MFSTIQDADIAFSTFYNALNSLVNKQAPLKVVSKRKLKQFSKPWITSGIRKLIKVKKNARFTELRSLYSYALSLLQTEDLYVKAPIDPKGIKKPSEYCK